VGRKTGRGSPNKEETEKERISPAHYTRGNGKPQKGGSHGKFLRRPRQTGIVLKLPLEKGKKTIWKREWTISAGVWVKNGHGEGQEIILSVKRFG